MGEDKSLLEIITRKGSLQLLYITGAHGYTRFTTCQTHLTVSDPTIGKRLNELVETDLLEREYREGSGPRVDYTLSPKTEDLYDPLAALFEWAFERDETMSDGENPPDTDDPDTQTCFCCQTSTRSWTTSDGEKVPWYRSLHDLIDVLAKTYALETIVYMREAEPVRFNRIMDAIGVTSNEALSTRLDQLDEAGLIIRRSHDEIPPYVEYSLTESGHELAARATPIVEWTKRAGA